MFNITYKIFDISGVKCIELGSEDYSYIHTKMNLFLNYLFQDPWSPDTVYYVNERQNVIWTSLGQVIPYFFLIINLIHM